MVVTTFSPSSCSSLSILIRNSTVLTEHTLHGGHFSCSPVRPSNHSPHYSSIALAFARICMSHTSLTAASSSNFQLILIFDDTIREIAQGRICCTAPRSARFLARFSGSFSSKLSQGRPYFSVRAASENIHSWIEQLNPTMNVLRACALSATLGYGYASENKIA